jgi:hypothetical protein
MPIAAMTSSAGTGEACGDTVTVGEAALMGRDAVSFSMLIGDLNQNA